MNKTACLSPLMFVYFDGGLQYRAIKTNRPLTEAFPALKEYSLNFERRGRSNRQLPKPDQTYTIATKTVVKQCSSHLDMHTEFPTSEVTSYNIFNILENCVCQPRISSPKNHQ